MGRRRLAVLSVSLAIVAGEAAAGAASSAPQLHESSSAATSTRLVTFTRSGGLAGKTVRLVVTKTRRVTATPDGKPFTLTTTQYQRLVSDLDRADLPSLPSTMKPDHVVADGFITTISARGRTVRIETGAAVPKRLQPLLARLTALLSRATAS